MRILKLFWLACIVAVLILAWRMYVKAEPAYVGSKTGLHLRSGRRTDAESITVMPYGSKVEKGSVRKVGEVAWALVTYDGQTGYVAGEFLQDEDPLDGMEYLGVWHITAYAYTGSPCANGNYPSTGYTVACNSLPFGTEIYIDGIGYHTVEDRGPGWLGNHWCDVYMGDTASCIQWGSQYRDVYLVP